MEPIKTTIGSQLRAAREEAGLTQAELAERAGLSQPHVSLLEREEQRPSIATLERLAAALGCGWIYDGADFRFYRESSGR